MICNVVLVACTVYAGKQKYIIILFILCIICSYMVCTICIMVCLLQYAERLVRAVEITTSDVCILARVLILTLVQVVCIQYYGY